jgi:hypothetical protein
MEYKEQDFIENKIKSHYTKNGNYDLEEIKKYFGEDNKIFIEDEVLKKRIEKVKNGNFGISEK